MNILQTLATLERGDVIERLDEGARRLALAVLEAEKAGRLTLTIVFKPTKSGAVELVSEVKVTPPKDEGSTLMFVTPEGNLQRQDPRQGELDGIRSVDVPPKATRTI